jgi:hypothetical protein
VNLDPVHVQWLSMVRYQTDLAVEQSHQPVPLAMIAVNGLHDAAEMLGLVTEVQHLPPPTRKSGFLDLYKVVRDGVEGDALNRHEKPLENLNNVRVRFKHYGVNTDEMTIERLRVTTVEFLTDAAAVGLGLDFANISMAGLIKPQEVREIVERAEQRWAAGDADEAMGDLRRAFDRAHNLYEDSKSPLGYDGIFRTRPPFGSVFGADHMAALGMHGDKGLRYVEAWLERMEKTLKLLAFGVDLRRFAYFQIHTPDISYTRTDGEGRIFLIDGKPKATEDSFRRCHRFVIDTCLQLARDDFTWDPAEHATVQRLLRASEENSTGVD